MRLKSLVAGLVGAVLVSSAAFAAEPIVIPPPVTPPSPVAAAPAGFDWSGIYVGANAFLGFNGGGAPVFIAGGQVGLNHVRGNFLVGAEFGIDGFFQGGASACCFVSALAKVGFLLGPTDRILVYGTAGAIGIGTGGGVGLFFAVVGAGAAVGIGERISLFGEYLVLPNGGLANGVGRIGLNFHF